MGVEIPVGYSQVVYVFRGPGAIKNSTMTLGVHFGTSADVPDIAANAYDAVTAGTGDNLCEAASMLTGWQFLGTDVTYMDESGPLIASHRATITGTKAGSPLPTNCSFLVSKSSATGGRAGRGRWFVPPFMLGESGIDGNGVIDSGAAAVLQGYLNVFMTQAAATALDPVILHSGAGLPAPITAMTLQPLLATQRRRMR